MTWVELLLAGLVCVIIGMLIAPKEKTQVITINSEVQPMPDEEMIQSSIHEIDPSMNIKRISPTSFYGLYEAEADKGVVVYVNHDGSAIIHGSFFEKDEGAYVNRTEEVYSRFVVETLGSIDEGDYILYEAEQEKSSVVVFTDPSCPYCQRFHSEVEQLNEAGITVKYLPFGRGGPGSESFAVLDSIWCSEDRQGALTDAKQGESLPTANCEGVAQKYFDVGESLNIQGTPYIFMEDGSVIRGYLPAESLIQALGLD